MPKFGLIENGAFAGRVQELDEAPKLAPEKNMAWLLYREETDAFDPLTQKLVESVVVTGNEIVRRRSAVALTLEESRDAVRAARRRLYDERGATLIALAEALWEKLIEGRPEKADAIQQVRLTVKQELPMP